MIGYATMKIINLSAALIILTTIKVMVKMAATVRSKTRSNHHRSPSLSF